MIVEVQTIGNDEVVACVVPNHSIYDMYRYVEMMSTL